MLSYFFLCCSYVKIGHPATPQATHTDMGCAPSRVIWINTEFYGNKKSWSSHPEYSGRVASPQLCSFTWGQLRPWQDFLAAPKHCPLASSLLRCWSHSHCPCIISHISSWRWSLQQWHGRTFLFMVLLNMLESLHYKMFLKYYWRTSQRINFSSKLSIILGYIQCSFSVPLFLTRT